MAEMETVGVWNDTSRFEERGWSRKSSLRQSLAEKQRRCWHALQALLSIMTRCHLDLIRTITFHT